MIRPSYALKLAHTKLKTKRLLLIVTVSVSALVFGIVIAGILILTGASRSADSYLRTALNEKYLVSVSPVVPNEVMGFGSMMETPSDTLRAHLLDLQKRYTDSQKKLAAQYGVTFDESTVDPILKPSPFGDKDALGNAKEVINRQSPAYQLYVTELQYAWLASTNATTAELRKIADARGATAYYHNRYASISYADTAYLSGGKEDLSKVVDPDIPGSDAIQNSSYTFTDQSLIKRYILPENQARRENKTAIPVVITKEEAVKFFGEKLHLADEPSGSAEKIAWMKTLQEKINGFTYQACYRNGAERSLIQEAMRQNQTTSNDDTAQKPVTTFNLPTDTCAPVTVNEDTRISAQKVVDAKLEEYQKAAGIHTQPTTQLLTFQIVGMMPASSMIATNLDDLPSLVDSLLSAQYQGGVFIPSQLYERLLEANQHKDILQSSVDSFGLSSEKFTAAGVVPAIIAFSSVADAKSFMDTYTCPGYDTDGCDKAWTSQVYGAANYLLIDDINERMSGVAWLALLIAVAIAAIVMSFTMARVIIDSRHETAIFRALGAKRHDIVGIYMTYSILIASLIVLFSCLLGVAGATVIELLYRDAVASYVAVAYGIFDGLDTFSLIGFDSVLVGSVVVIVFGVGMSAVIVPLIRNVRRNPIRDMRDSG
jgi:hypothetical protein